MEEPAEQEDRWCGLFSCVCRWRFPCSPRIAQVSPGWDYACLPPADADGRRPAWSLLVGLIDGEKLRLHRLRVTRCGRVLGRSDDTLEIFHDDVGTKPVLDAAASLAPDGSSLCVLHQDYETPPLALQLPLQPHADPSPLPPLPVLPQEACCPISAAGHIWAPCTHFDFENRTFVIVMLRLLQEDGRSRWEQVGDPIVGPDEHDIYNPYSGRFLQGYAVLPRCGGGGDHTLILVSLRQCGLFFTFDCSTSGWTPVDTTAGSFQSKSDYIPILGHGVYIQEDETIYMLRDNTIYAYKFHCNEEEEEEDHSRLKLELLVKIDSVCPFSSKSGYSYLAHLGGRLMCSVWISGGAESCSCQNLHVNVSTFQLPAQGGIEVLHSTCRRIDMLPDPHTNQSCFLQEYKDEESSHSLVLQLEEDPVSNSPAPLLLECCRWNLLPKEQRPPRIVPMKPAIAHINRDLFIICQAGTQSSVYKTNVMDNSGKLERDDSKLLKLCYSIPSDSSDDGEEQPPQPWHFICDKSNIYAFSGITDSRHVFDLVNEGSSFDSCARQPTADPFVMVIQVGYQTIALTDTLQVFYQTNSSHNTPSMWSRYDIDPSHVPIRKVKLSGYAALGDTSFIVSDTVTGSCLLFDLSVKQWRVVMPCAAFEFRGAHLSRTSPISRFLIGRSVFVDGFIYSCEVGELAAYELLQEGDSVFLSDPIYLSISLYMESWEGERMCLDYAGRDVSGGIIFFVVQGVYSPSCPEYDVWIATVQVKTEKTPREEIMKPVEIDRLDCVARSTGNEKGAVSTRSCFAVSSSF